MGWNWTAALRILPLLLQAMTIAERIFPRGHGQEKEDLVVTTVQDTAAAPSGLWGGLGLPPHVMADPGVLEALRDLIAAIVVFVRAIQQVLPERRSAAQTTPLEPTADRGAEPRRVHPPGDEDFDGSH